MNCLLRNRTRNFRASLTKQRSEKTRKIRETHINKTQLCVIHLTNAEQKTCLFARTEFYQVQAKINKNLPSVNFIPTVNKMRQADFSGVWKTIITFADVCFVIWLESLLILFFDLQFRLSTIKYLHTLTHALAPIIVWCCNLCRKMYSKLDVEFNPSVNVVGGSTLFFR